MIKMVATGTGARNVVIGWLLCLRAWGFLCRPCCKPACSGGSPGMFVPERRKSQPLAALKWSLQELICSAVGGWGARGTGRKGAWFTEAECCQESFRPQMVTSVPLPFLVHTHPSGTLQMPTSTWERVGRNTWPRGLRAVAPVWGGSLPEGMAHCNCQIKPEPQDKQSSWGDWEILYSMTFKKKRKNQNLPSSFLLFPYK